MLPSPDLINQCAPTVAPETMIAIIEVESGGNAYALGINGFVRNPPHPKTANEAVRWARYYINLGYSVDLGLMQINSRNLKGLGYQLEQIFEPCTNLKAGSSILSKGYLGAAKRYGHGQAALKAALSAYNTGNYEHGFHNGYVAKYYPGNRLQVTVRAKAPAALLAKGKRSLNQSDRVQVPVALPVIVSPYTADTTIYQLKSADDIISWE
jgi:type IV secretion system protein VirB1